MERQAEDGRKSRLTLEGRRTSFGAAFFEIRSSVRVGRGDLKRLGFITNRQERILTRLSTGRDGSAIEGEVTEAIEAAARGVVSFMSGKKEVSEILESDWVRELVECVGGEEKVLPKTSESLEKLIIAKLESSIVPREKSKKLDPPSKRESGGLSTARSPELYYGFRKRF